jgi:hypothetical protein
MTDQTMFDTVVTHLLTQNSTSIGIGGTCLYRGPDNKRCAIGCLIPDEMYTKALEYKPVRILVENPALNSEIATYLSQFNLDLLIRVQQVHDAYQPKDWYLILRNVAAQFKLKFNPPKLQSETA